MRKAQLARFAQLKAEKKPEKPRDGIKKWRREHGLDQLDRRVGCDVLVAIPHPKTDLAAPTQAASGLTNKVGT